MSFVESISKIFRYFKNDEHVSIDMQNSDQMSECEITFSMNILYVMLVKKVVVKNGQITSPLFRVVVRGS